VLKPFYDIGRFILEDGKDGERTGYHRFLSFCLYRFRPKYKKNIILELTTKYDN